MAWEDNRNKSVRDIKREEHLAWLQKQIQEMEGPVTIKPVLERIKPRIRRNGKWVE